MKHAALDPLDCAATAHPGSKGSQYRSTTGHGAGVEDENREFPITARDVFLVADDPALDRDLSTRAREIGMGPLTGFMVGTVGALVGQALSAPFRRNSDA